MVFFTCNGCGSSLKKNQVEKHQQFQCRKSQHLSCMDCSKDFYGDEYKVHVKCISEDEKYAGKGWVAKPGQNKNEKKQSEWVAMVQDVVSNVGNTDRELTNMLQRISQYENIPRKKPKFINFLKNSMGQRTSPALMDRAWDLISKALEQQKIAKMQNNTNNQKPLETNGTSQNGTKRRLEEENEPLTESKKMKNTEEENLTPTTINESTEADHQNSKIKWCTIAKTILRAQEEQQLPLKKFQKKIIPEYLNRMGDNLNDTTVEILWAKCLKKLSKNPKFKIHKEIIKLTA